MSAGATAHICKATPVPWFVLVHAKHGRTAHDRHMYNSGLPRMLNVNGRWSSHATREVPVLVWHDQAAAAEALAVCQEHRGGGLIVSNFWNSDIELGREVVLFAPGHGPALRGYVSTDASAAAKAEAARLKALASAAFLVGRATGDARLVLRARLLSPKAGSGARTFSPERPEVPWPPQSSTVALRRTRKSPPKLWPSGWTLREGSWSSAIVWTAAHIRSARSGECCRPPPQAQEWVLCDRGAQVNPAPENPRERPAS
jgi:hypothetical protein